MNKQKNSNQDNKDDCSKQLSINFETSENREPGKVIVLKDHNEKQLEKKIISQIIRNGKSF